MKGLLASLVIALAALCSGAATAQDKWPSRPVTVIVPFAAGGNTDVMARIFAELYRITKRGGWVAFEVGEVRKGKIRLEEHVIPLGLDAGFSCEALLINQQRFTKTANIWGVGNNRLGTNTNRIVVFRKLR